MGTTRPTWKSFQKYLDIDGGDAKFYPEVVRENAFSRLMEWSVKPMDLGE